MKICLSIYRYNAEFDEKPYMQEYTFDNQENKDLMLLDILIKLKEYDSSLSFRKSCREGVCGSDGINVNGINVLACTTPLSKIRKVRKKIYIRPLPGLPVIRDLIVDMTKFFDQYRKIKPFLMSNRKLSKKEENIQYPEQHKKMKGFYECILCACCSTFCPSFWWNPDKFIGPAGLLNSYRFISDSRDQGRKIRLKLLNDSFSVFRCHNIMNCVHVCPKKLNPNEAIHKIKNMIIKYDL